VVLLRDDGDEIRRVVKTERSRAGDEETLPNTSERHLASLILRATFGVLFHRHVFRQENHHRCRLIRSRFQRDYVLRLLGRRRFAHEVDSIRLDRRVVMISPPKSALILERQRERQREKENKRDVNFYM
jgi:hypothetical protein